MTFANPYYLYLLLLIPLFGFIYWLAVLARRRKLQKFGPMLNGAELMPDASKYMPTVKIVLELLAVAFIVIALARPYVNKVNISDNKERTVSGIEVMVCFDVSNSMKASATPDPRGISRLQRSKHILEKLIDRLHDDKVGLIVFAGDAYTQLPITTDFISAKMFVNDLSTEMVPTQGTAIGTALDMAINSFTPTDDFRKAIILITDGENFEDDAAEMAKRAAGDGIQIDVIGMGTAQGAPIPVGKSGTEFMNDFNGEQVITKLDENACREIAKIGNGVYVNGSSSSAVSDVADKLNELATTEYRRSAAPSPAGELFHIFAIIALVLVLIDVFLPYSKISMLKNINFFTKNK